MLAVMVSMTFLKSPGPISSPWVPSAEIGDTLNRFLLLFSVIIDACPSYGLTAN